MTSRRRRQANLVNEDSDEGPESARKIVAERLQQRVGGAQGSPSRTTSSKKKSKSELAMEKAKSKSRTKSSAGKSKTPTKSNGSSSSKKTAVQQAMEKAKEKSKRKTSSTPRRKEISEAVVDLASPSPVRDTSSSKHSSKASKTPKKRVERESDDDDSEIRVKKQIRVTPKQNNRNVSRISPVSPIPQPEQVLTMARERQMAARRAREHRERMLALPRTEQEIPKGRLELENMANQRAIAKEIARITQLAAGERRSTRSSGVLIAEASESSVVDETFEDDEVEPKSTCSKFLSALSWAFGLALVFGVFAILMGPELEENLGLLQLPKPGSDTVKQIVGSVTSLSNSELARIAPSGQSEKAVVSLLQSVPESERQQYFTMTMDEFRSAMQMYKAQDRPLIIASGMFLGLAIGGLIGAFQ